MLKAIVPLLLWTAAVANGQPAVEAQSSGVTASLRGVSAVSERVGWATGTKGTVLRTVDGGQRWEALTVPGAAELDFRDVHAESESVAYVLSAGPGALSRVYKTVDGGKNWSLALTNPDAAGFLDALAFWDARRGLVMGDPVDGTFVILSTVDGGQNWVRRPAPAAVPGEGGFAASGTCLVVGEGGTAWFASGGIGGARVWRSQDWGKTWSVASTPVRNDLKTAGIFSLAFRGRVGVAVGGDYQDPVAAAKVAAVTRDGGRTWRPVSAGGFRSAVVFAGRKAVAVGSGGVSWSTDEGEAWQPVEGAGWHAISVTKEGVGWVAGSGGRLGRVTVK